MRAVRRWFALLLICEAIFSAYAFYRVRADRPENTVSSAVTGLAVLVVGVAIVARMSGDDPSIVAAACYAFFCFLPSVSLVGLLAFSAQLTVYAAVISGPVATVAIAVLALLGLSPARAK